MSIAELFIRILCTILALIFISRINGPKQISQMNFYDYVVGITVGSLAATTSLTSDILLIHGVLAITLYLLSGSLMSWLSDKNMPLRRFLTGKPIILIDNGKIQWKSLKRARMNINELLSSLRYGGYFNINEVNYAILEPNGKLSILPKWYARQPKLKDLKITSEQTQIYENVIIDGCLMKENLRDAGKSEKWLFDELKSQHISSLNEIALAVLDNNTLTVFLKNTSQSTHSSLI